MGTVTALPRKLDPDTAGAHIRAEMKAIAETDKRNDERRIEVGHRLNAIKPSVGHGAWLLWLDKHKISRQTANLYMRMASGEETPDDERTRVREAVRKTRSKLPLRNSNLPPADESLDPIQDECTDCENPQARWQHSCAFMLGEILAMRAYWRREFGDWEKFEVSSQLVQLATQARRELDLVAAQLKGEQNE